MELDEGSSFHGMIGIEPMVCALLAPPLGIGSIGQGETLASLKTRQI
jgi:hypothetical protein